METSLKMATKNKRCGGGTRGTPPKAWVFGGRVALCQVDKHPQKMDGVECFLLNMSSPKEVSDKSHVLFYGNLQSSKSPSGQKRRFFSSVA